METESGNFSLQFLEEGETLKMEYSQGVKGAEVKEFWKRMDDA